MKAYRDVALQPASQPLLADDLIEFHLARILLLLRLCGRNDRIAGLTKFAKLDFFVRYPEFFERARERTVGVSDDGIPSAVTDTRVESSMVRHHYGPWDKRYYQLLSQLGASSLVKVVKSGVTYNIELTEAGVTYAERLRKDDAFAQLVAHMQKVSKVFGGKNGNTLKNLIYETFGDEVAGRPLGKEIR